jgi:hypothetical protein
VIDLVFRLFRPLGYVLDEQYAYKRVDLPLSICGENRHAETSVCIINHSQESNHIVLLVQAVKRSKHEPVNTPAQLVAEAVAAFNKNNAKREAIGHPPLAEQVSHFSLLTLFGELVLLSSSLPSSWSARRLCSIRFPSPERCRHIFAMGHILQRKPVCLLLPNRSSSFQLV